MAELTFSARAVLLRLDSSVYDFSTCEFRLAQQPVSVYGEDLGCGVIGYAHVGVSEDRRRLEAALFVKYATPERFDIEVGARTLYARPMGVLQMTPPNTGGFIRDGLLVVDPWIAPAMPLRPVANCFEIRGLCLTGSPPTDRRITGLVWEIELGDRQ